MLRCRTQSIRLAFLWTSSHCSMGLRAKRRGGFEGGGGGGGEEDGLCQRRL